MNVETIERRDSLGRIIHYVRCPDCGCYVGKKKHQCKSVDLKGIRYCADCGKVKMKNIGRERYQKICSKCTGIRNRIYENKLKRQAVKLFGNKCQKCGYGAYIECLEFHHRDAAEKQSRDFIRIVLKYPEKFKMLCNRCHRELHVDEGNNDKSKLGGI